MVAGPVRRTLFQTWFAIEAIPIYAVVGLAVGGAGYYVGRLARGPDIIWTRDNAEPWQTVKPNENTKFMTGPEGDRVLTKSWSRDKL